MHMLYHLSVITIICELHVIILCCNKRIRAYKMIGLTIFLFRYTILSLWPVIVEEKEVYTLPCYYTTSQYGLKRSLSYKKKASLTPVHFTRFKSIDW